MAYLRFKKLDHSDPITICKLIFTPDKRGFLPGDMIQGLLIVSLTAKRELSFHGFKVAMEGTSITKYNERRDSAESRTEIFLDTYKYVYGKEPPQVKSNQIGMAAGVHKFPFAFHIPSEIPGSFSNPFGEISYHIVAYIHMPFNRILRKADKVFDVKSRLDLDRSILSPIEFVDLLGGNNCQIKVTLRVPQSGFLMGEEIPFGIELENPNTQEITSVSVVLVEKGIYHPGNVRRGTKTATVIATLETSDLDGCYGAVWIWTDGLRIPTGIRSTNDKGIIQTHYCLKVQVTTNPLGESGTQCMQSAEVPIIIGTTFEGNNIARKSANPKASTSRNSRQPQAISENLDALSVDSPGVQKERPPSYSTLRTRSRSLEALPPPYEETVVEESPDE